MTRCLVVTNDFPTRLGGIETFVHALVGRFPPDRVVVYTSNEPGADRFDAAQSYPIIRDPSRTTSDWPGCWLVRLRQWV